MWVVDCGFRLANNRIHISERLGLSINVLIAHSTPLIQAGLVAIFSAQQGINVVAPSPNKADVAVTDFDGLMRAGSCWSCPVIVVMRHTGERELMAAARNGASGYVTQACAAGELLEAVQALYEGRSYFGGASARTLAELLHPCDLTRRENDVLLLLAEGFSNKEIARNLNIGVSTVKTHLKSVMCKLDVKSRTQAFAVAVQRGLVLTEPHPRINLPTRT